MSKSLGVVVLMLMLMTVTGCSQVFDRWFRGKGSKSPASHQAENASKDEGSNKSKEKALDPATEELIRDIHAQVDEIKDIARRALAVRDDPKTTVLAVGVASCRDEHEVCVDRGNRLAKTNLVASGAGIALYFVRNLPDNLTADTAPIYQSQAKRMHSFAQRVLAEAEEMAQEAAINAEENARRAREQEEIKVAEATCLSSPLKCRQECAQDNQPFCVFLAFKLLDAKPPQFSKAHATLEKACKADFTMACRIAKGVEKRMRAIAAELDGLWGNVRFAVNDIADRKFMLRQARQRLRGRRNAIGMARMQAHIRALIREQYCHAANEFRSNSTAMEFRKRANDHCSKHPPTGYGFGGSQVTLGAECRQVFASACPAAPRASR